MTMTPTIKEMNKNKGQDQAKYSKFNFRMLETKIFSKKK